MSVPVGTIDTGATVDVLAVDEGTTAVTDSELAVLETSVDAPIGMTTVAELEPI